ncbi:hypothetical protein [Actinomadura montaniterrae]|nr:hypothetical protein [Actinomadura montaniterrae]
MAAPAQATLLPLTSQQHRQSRPRSSPYAKLHAEKGLIDPSKQLYNQRASHGLVWSFMSEWKRDFFTRRPICGLITSLAGGSPDPIEWEVLRYQRLLCPDYIETAFSSARVDFVAAELDYMSQTHEDTLLAQAGSSVQSTWQIAAREHAGSIPGLLALLAQLMRQVGTKPPPDFDEVPLGRWEAMERYPRLFNLAELVKECSVSSEHAITNEHPQGCQYYVSPMIAEALEALALCQQYRKFRRLFRQFVYLEAEELAAIADAAFEHMKVHHRRRTWISPADFSRF